MMIACKAANVVKVPAQCTSRTCHECGAAGKRSRRTREDRTCIACGHAANADINAARNILAKAMGDEASGIGASARREALALAASTTREIGARVA